MSEQSFNQPLITLKGVGPKLENTLQGMAINTLQDLLFHLPLRYEDRTKITLITHLRAGAFALVHAEVRAADIVYGKRRSLVAKIQDGSGVITLRLFHFSASQLNNFSPGTFIQCYGEVRTGASGLEFYHPEYSMSPTPLTQPTAERLTAVYSTVKTLQQRTWRKLIEQALKRLQADPPPDYVREYVNSHTSLIEALNYIHQPPVDANINTLVMGEHPLQQRLIGEELAAQYIGHRLVRQQLKQQAGIAMPQAKVLQQQFLAALPFKPTAAQRRVSNEINADMALSSPMLRLVQGDVGSGKTLVAAMAALNAIGNGYQVALMAPTEILAEQHYQSFVDWFSPLGINVELLVGNIKGKKRSERLAALFDNKIQLLIGTQAIFQDEVKYVNLALVIVDEQHRFGVHQRLTLKQKATTPHQLVMTATPIPRTLAMTQFSELDCSIIDELPAGRKPITTTLLEQSRREPLIKRVKNACETGRQAYWVCTLIEESEALQAQAAEDSAILLAEQLPSLSVALIHGRLKAVEKHAVMQAFKDGDVDLLVATTVIEVGVDVPNASVMVIENPERLGLAQLHQLRGRVGRGEHQSHCVLLYQTPLSQNGKRRLNAMRNTTDGFLIAEEDLAIRGPGEILGTRQTGDLHFKIADLQRDQHLVESAQRLGDKLMQHLTPAQQQSFVERWLAGKSRYADV